MAHRVAPLRQLRRSRRQHRQPGHGEGRHTAGVHFNAQTGGEQRRATSGRDSRGRFYTPRCLIFRNFPT